jgi:hypothetical protein
MGLIGAVAQGAIGLFGAASQSADYARAAQQEREQAGYNSSISRYNSEVAAQSTMFSAESEAQNLRRQKEVVRQNSSSKQASMALEGVQRAGQAKANYAALNSESSSGPLAIFEEEQKNFLARQQEQAASDYSQSMFEYQAGSTLESATKTAYNQRQQGLFQGAAAAGAGFAKAAEYDSKSASALTSGIFGAALNFAPYATGLLGGGGSAPSSGGGGDYGLTPPIQTGGIFGQPIQTSNSYGGDFGSFSGGKAYSGASLFGGY